MKNNSVILREDLSYVSDSMLNRLVSIKDTDYNHSVRYGSQVKRQWVKLYEQGNSCYEIAQAYGATYETVRKAVDPEYNEVNKKRHADSSRKHYASHKEQYAYDPEYRQELISRKREYVNTFAHLKAL